MAAENTATPPGFVRTSSDKPMYELHPGRQLFIGATGADTGEAFGVIEEVIPPGDGVPPHIHHTADELFYVLSGEITFTIGDLRVKGGTGTVAFIPHGTEHDWQNWSDEPARMLGVLARAGFERFLVELSDLPGASRNRETINALAAPYQTIYTGPRPTR